MTRSRTLLAGTSVIPITLRAQGNPDDGGFVREAEGWAGRSPAVLLPVDRLMMRLTILSPLFE
jgi:hypothetical protein